MKMKIAAILNGTSGISYNNNGYRWHAVKNITTWTEAEHQAFWMNYHENLRVGKV